MLSLTALGAIAGTVATLLFVGSALPMLIRAHRTRDLSSYSPANLVIANVGNLAQTLYVLTLPLGPVWAMHAFNVIVSGLMLLWWVRHHGVRRAPVQVSSTDHHHPTGASRSTTEENLHDHSDHCGDRQRRAFARL